MLNRNNQRCSLVQILILRVDDDVALREQVGKHAIDHLMGEIKDRARGMDGARPAGPGEVGLSGAERRLAGGIGAKKVDVTWATEESGLILAVSVKTILFKDSRTQNFQKNLR